MTFIEINKKDILNPIILLSSVVLIASIMFFLFLYNNTVTLRHNLKTNTAIVAKEQLKNAELRDTVYKIVNNTKQIPFLRSRNLVMDYDPYYAQPSFEVSYLPNISR